MSKPGQADLLLENARVATLDANDSFASAVAVWRDRILAVGDSGELATLAGPQTRRIDRGIDFALDGIAQALQRHPRADHRSRVEHCCCVTPAILQRLKSLQVIDSSATGFMYSLGDAYIDNRGEAEMEFMWPHRALIDAGVHAAGHSDAPICGVNPWQIIGAMVTRSTDSGRAIGRSQQVSLTEALRAYTTEGAFIGFEEASKGSIEAGKLADLALLDQDIFSVAVEGIGATRVDMTVLGGEVVFER